MSTGPVPQASILELLAEEGPLSDATLGPKFVDQQGAAEVEEHTRQLATDRLVEPSEFAPDCWQITDSGHRLVADPGGAEWPDSLS